MAKPALYFVNGKGITDAWARTMALQAADTLATGNDIERAASAFVRGGWARLTPAKFTELLDMAARLEAREIAAAEKGAEFGPR